MKANRRGAETQSELTERGSVSRNRVTCSKLLWVTDLCSNACVEFFALGSFRAPFSLTLTLSLREMEQQSALADTLTRPRAVTAFWFFAGERYGAPRRNISLQNRQTSLPLPKGEGRREGKGTLDSSKALPHSPVRSLTIQSLRLCASAVK
jgi:hypothetical protein